MCATTAVLAGIDNPNFQAERLVQLEEAVEPVSNVGLWSEVHVHLNVQLDRKTSESSTSMSCDTDSKITMTSLHDQKNFDLLSFLQNFPPNSTEPQAGLGAPACGIVSSTFPSSCANEPGNSQRSSLSHDSHDYESINSKTSLKKGSGTLFNRRKSVRTKPGESSQRRSTAPIASPRNSTGSDTTCSGSVTGGAVDVLHYDDDSEEFVQGTDSYTCEQTKGEIEHRSMQLPVRWAPGYELGTVESKVYDDLGRNPEATCGGVSLYEKLRKVSDSTAAGYEGLRSMRRIWPSVPDPSQWTDRRNLKFQEIFPETSTTGLSPCDSKLAVKDDGSSDSSDCDDTSDYVTY